jgi:uncharacterized phage-associated protein
MPAPYSAKAVANYFLELAEANGEALSPMKLQKLIYFAHGWHLALYNEPLINEPIYAWKFGPVITSVYHEFKKFGYSPITGTAIDDDEDGVWLPSIPREDERTRGLLKRVWDVYRKFTAVQLSNMTHAPDTPWRTTWERGEGMPELRIDNGLIRENFLAKTRKNAEAARQD